jgi:hypothetical protein
MITVTLEKRNGVAIGASENALMKIDRAMLARNPQPLTTNTAASKCKLWIWVAVGAAQTVEEWLVTETFTAVTDALTTDEAEQGAEVLTNKATTFATINDTKYPSVEAVVEVASPIWYATPAGSGTYTFDLTGIVPTAYYAGMRVNALFGTTNGGAATINLNSLGAKAITKGTAGTTALSASDLVITKIYTLVYDGTRFQITNL